jgi:hypothetical protein
MRPWLRVLSLVSGSILLLASCGILGGDEVADGGSVDASAIATAAGVAFLPPIGSSDVLSSGLDASVRLFIEVFGMDASTGQATGSPLGPSFSTALGTITVVSDEAGGHYHANWKTSDTNVADGTLVRVELRLGNAPVNQPACGALTVDIDAGCIAFVDVELWRNVGQAKKARAGTPAEVDDSERIIALVNGQTLPIKLHVTAGAANTAPVVTITAPAPGTQFPATEEVAFAASAFDLEDGDLSNAIVWNSNLDGFLGTGPAITAILSPGTHIVTASASDSGGRATHAGAPVEVIYRPVPAGFTDWVTADFATGRATGLLGHVAVVLQGDVAGANPNHMGGRMITYASLDGSDTLFDRSYYTPRLPSADIIEIQAYAYPYTYTVTFDQPVPNPILHICSTASALAFLDADVVRISGQEVFTVSDNTVVGWYSELYWDEGPVTDANGTVQLIGDYSSFTFTATWLATYYGDGICLQIGTPGG